MDGDYARQEGILPPMRLHGQDVDIVGGGSLGSSILLVILKLGFGLYCRVRVTDFDTVMPVNLPVQWFLPLHAATETPKAQALAEMAELLANARIETFECRFTGDEPRRLGPVVIVAVDSLEERRAIWERLRKRDDVRLLIDPRVGGEVFEVHAIEPGRDNPELYERSLGGDGVEPYRAGCSEGIMYTMTGGAALVASILRAFVMGQPFHRHVAFDFRNFELDKEAV